MEPPMLCMLLRKHLGSGRIMDVRRVAGDRILEIDINALNELGDQVTRTLIIEIMGRQFVGLGVVGPNAFVKINH